MVQYIACNDTKLHKYRIFGFYYDRRTSLFIGIHKRSYI